METRDILNDVDNAIAVTWGSVAQCRQKESIYQCTHDLKALKPRIKSLKRDKQVLSRKFGVSGISDQEKDTLKQQMQLLSQQLKDIESERKELEAALSSMFNHKNDQKNHKSLIPNRFIKIYGCSTEFTIQPVAGNHNAEWDDFVSNHPNASPYHLYGWRSVIEKSFGHQAIYLAAKDPSGQYCGVLPLVKLKSRLFGSFAVSMPYFNYGGPLANSKKIEHALIKAGSDHCLPENLEHMEIRSVHPLDDLPAKNDKVSMVLNLPGCQKTLDAELGTKLRAQIKQAKTHSLEVRIGASELLNDFYTVFSRNMRDLGTPVYAKSFFANILTKFPDQATLVCLYKNKQPISTGFLIGYKDILEIPWASTLKKYNRLSANMLLYRFILGFAVDNKYSYFDFGRSSKESNTFRFKKQWGANPVQHHWCYWLRDKTSMPNINPDNKKYQFAISCWKMLPVWATKIIGPNIVKNLP